MRITGGRWRSRALKAPRGTATRPTSDRVREALFSMLVSDGLLGAGEAPRILDLYAGSGALAFEALSRGASGAVLVEEARDAVAVIRQNARELAAEREIQVFDARVERALPKLQGPFGVVFLDPPYADVKTPSFAAILAAAGALVAPDGALVLEHASTDEPPTVAGLELDRSRRYGDTTVTLYRAGAAGSPGPENPVSAGPLST
jgi:16S rRNA (guanine966-N2)-methyltransferase